MKFTEWLETKALGYDPDAELPLSLNTGAALVLIVTLLLIGFALGGGLK